VVVELLGALELDALMFTHEGVYLDWGTLNGEPLSSHALNWVGHYLAQEITEAVASAATAQTALPVVRLLQPQ